MNNLRFYCSMLLLLLLSTNVQCMEQEQGTHHKKPAKKRIQPKSIKYVVTSDEEDQNDSDKELAITHQMQQMQVKEKFPQYHFSPNIKDVLVKLVSEEQEGMVSVYYRFTLFPVAQAIVKKQKNEIPTSLLLDQGYKDDYCGILRLMISNGVDIREILPADQFESIHHKFIVFNKNVDGKRLLVTGSFNATGNADLINEENVVIEDRGDIDLFIQKYNQLYKRSKALTLQTCKNLAKEKPYSYFINQIPVNIFTKDIVKKEEYKKWLNKVIYVCKKEKTLAQAEISRLEDKAEQEVQHCKIAIYERKIALANSLNENSN